jgi:hypothetical protein
VTVPKFAAAVATASASVLLWSPAAPVGEFALVIFAAAAAALFVMWSCDAWEGVES